MSESDRQSVGIGMPFFGAFAPALEYLTDAAQRTVLFWDVMRQRGNAYREHLAKTAPQQGESKSARAQPREYR